MGLVQEGLEEWIMATLTGLEKMAASLPGRSEKSPLLFVGHGSPINGIESNAFNAEWMARAAKLDRPAAILVISAHWLTNGTRVTAMDNPRTIHDFRGFPEELFAVQYPAPGAPALAEETRRIVKSAEIELDHDWGLDHGTWSVLRQMYPEATIPVFQLSIDYQQPAAWHYQLATELAGLREKGVMIIGSGNMVHNLRMLAWDKMDQPGFGYDWAEEMHVWFKQKISQRDHKSLIHYEDQGLAAKLAVPTPDHYYPLIYTLGLQAKNEEALFFNDVLLAGSLNMTSVEFG